MGKLIHNTNKKLLRYNNFINSITENYEGSSYKYSYVDQIFLGRTYRLFEVTAYDSYPRIVYINYSYMNGERYSDKYNLKYHSNSGYWGTGTIDQTYPGNCLIKEENVFPNNSLNDAGYVRINIPSTCVNQLLSTGIDIFVTLNSDLLGDNIYGQHYTIDTDWPSEISPYYNMSTDYQLSYNFNRSIDLNKSLRFTITPPAKYNYYANVFIYIPNCDDVTCNITYNPGSMNGHDVHDYDVNFSYTELYGPSADDENKFELWSSGVGYSFYIDGNESKARTYDWCGTAEITFTNVS